MMTKSAQLTRRQAILPLIVAVLMAPGLTGIAMQADASAGSGAFQPTTSSASPAWTYQMLADFNNFTPELKDPVGTLAEGPHGNFYVEDTIYQSGIYKITPSGQAIHVRSWADDPSQGLWPKGNAGMTRGSDGNLYGVVTHGGIDDGRFGYGVIFKLTPDGEYTVLHRFNGTDGAYPEEPLVEAPDGYLYGTTSAGGNHITQCALHNPILGACATPVQGDGVVFRIHPDGSDYQVLLKTNCATPRIPFNNVAPNPLDPGCHPVGSLIVGQDDNLYGTMRAGGAYGGGTLYELQLTPIEGLFSPSLHQYGPNFRVIHSFSDAWHPPTGLIQGTDGNFYGTTTYGGVTGGTSSSQGIIWKITPLGVTTTLHQFNYNDGGTPKAPPIQVGDYLYGVTDQSTSDSLSGNIYKMRMDGSEYQVVWDFPDPTVTPRAPLLLASDGNLYGTTTGDVIFRLSPVNDTVTTFYHYEQPNRVERPTGLAEGPNGTFYGVSKRGGTCRDGGFFRMTEDGNITPGRSICDIHEGQRPRGGITLASDGNFYGTTVFGGPYNDTAQGPLFPKGCGVVYKLTPQGDYTVHHGFMRTDGCLPVDVTLVQGPDGALYGTTAAGGDFDEGTIFRLALDGAYSVLHSFTAGTDGANPNRGLVLGSDGALYGTANGGTNGCGVVFRVTTTGSFSTLHSFSRVAATGECPKLRGPLTAGSDGTMYGTTLRGGTSGEGSVYSITTTGQFHTTYDFSPGGTDGQYPWGLIWTPAGTLVGAAHGSDQSSSPGGLLFQLNPADGTFTTIHGFDADRAWKWGPRFVVANDGAIYGISTYQDNGSGTERGTIFRLNPK